MSFIPKNPLSLPEIEHTPSTPSGTRGLFAKEDGWYEVDDKGDVKKLGGDNSLKQTIDFTNDYHIESREDGLYLVKDGMSTILLDASCSSYANGANWAGSADVASSAEMDRNFNYIDEHYTTKEETQIVKDYIYTVKDSINTVKSSVYYGDVTIVPSNIGSFTFTLSPDGSGAAIEQTTIVLPKDVVVPYEAVVDGVNYPVTFLGSTSFSSRDMTSLVLPNTVTKIGYRAFEEIR